MLTHWYLVVSLVVCDVSNVAARRNGSSSQRSSISYPSNGIAALNLQRKIIDLAGNAKTNLEILPSRNKNVYDLQHKSEKYLRKKMKLLRDQTTNVLARSRDGIANQTEFQRKLKVLYKVVQHYNKTMPPLSNLFVKKRGGVGFGQEKFLEQKLRKARSADRALDNDLIQNIVYNLETLMEDISRWKKWIELGSKEWNDEKRSAYRSALHLMISVLYQYKHLTYEIMFEKALLTALDVDAPAPENDFMSSSNRVVNLVNVNNKILIRVYQDDYQISFHEYRVGGFVSFDGGLTKASINNFTNELKISPEQEKAVVEFFNKNSNKSFLRWTPWSQWSTCSVTCGTDGLRTRQRVCVVVNIQPNTTICSGGDFQRIPCSVEKLCLQEISTLCWLENYGFLKENIRCDCSLAPHLCMNGGFCVRKAMLDGSRQMFPRFVLSCQCSTWYWGPICQHVWYTSWIIHLLLGTVCVALLIFSILTLLCCLRKDKNPKPGDRTHNNSKPLQEFRSKNITNSSVVKTSYNTLLSTSDENDVPESVSVPDLTSPMQLSSKQTDLEMKPFKSDMFTESPSLGARLLLQKNKDHFSDTKNSNFDGEKLNEISVEDKQFSKYPNTVDMAQSGDNVKNTKYLSKIHSSRYNGKHFYIRERTTNDEIVPNQLIPTSINNQLCSEYSVGPTVHDARQLSEPESTSSSSLSPPPDGKDGNWRFPRALSTKSPLTINVSRADNRVPNNEWMNKMPDVGQNFACSCHIPSTCHYNCQIPPCSCGCFRKVNNSEIYFRQIFEQLPFPMGSFGPNKNFSCKLRPGKTLTERIKFGKICSNLKIPSLKRNKVDVVHGSLKGKRLQVTFQGKAKTKTMNASNKSFHPNTKCTNIRQRLVFS